MLLENFNLDFKDYILRNKFNISKSIDTCFRGYK